MPTAAIANGLNAFQLALQGVWTNQPLPGTRNGEGGRDNPLAYNVMPLPQASAPQGYILKNCTVFETIRFNSDQDPSALAIPTTAPNRGSDTLQLPTALYYEQQVFFGNGPSTGKVVHTENGAWLNLTTGRPLTGPYDNAMVVEPNRQPPAVTIAKQISVPHGNSVLALGHFDAPTAGRPVIADSPSVLPSPAGLATDRYTTLRADLADFENPNPDWTLNPKLPLQMAVGGARFPGILKVTSHIHWTVTTRPLDGGQGATMNIPFEQRKARVSDYTADYWLLSTDGRPPDQAGYLYLAYAQVITLDLALGGKIYSFPHVTTNLLTRQP